MDVRYCLICVTCQIAEIGDNRMLKCMDDKND